MTDMARPVQPALVLARSQPPAARARDAVARLGVLLTARQAGGHEAALFGWLADAMRLHGLSLDLALPAGPLQAAAVRAGLDAALRPLPPTRMAIWQCLRRWPRERPLLLAPGSLHAAAWALAAALAQGLRVWVYVPMAFSARRMGLRHAALRDRLLAPWLRQVEAWITLDDCQRHWLTEYWHVRAPIHLLPNIARVPMALLPPPGPSPDGRLRVAVVGRLDAHQKGLDWLGRQLASQPLLHGTLRWHIQGAGPAEQALLEVASTLGPRHLQVLPHGPMADALAHNDVLLLASRFEGVPLVALEATVMGRPVVASRQSGLGWLLPPQAEFEFGDSAGMLRALHRLREPGVAASLLAHARAQLARHASPPVYRAALASLVRQWQPAPAGGASR